MASRARLGAAGGSAAADVVLVSHEYKPETVGWRMERQEIEGPRKTLFRR